MKWKMKTVKKTFSIRENLIEELNNFPNKSSLVNDWLELILNRRKYEEALAKKYQKELDNFEIKDFEIERFTYEEIEDLKKWSNWNYDEICKLVDNLD